MKKLIHFFRHKWLPLFFGGFLAIVASAICPVFTIGFWKVAYANECALGFVGPGGDPAPDSLLSSAIGASPTGKFCYGLMYKIGNPQGKIYATIGMRYLDFKEFTSMRDGLVMKPGEVVLHWGCSVWEDTFENTLYFEEETRYADLGLRKTELDRLRAHFQELKSKAHKA